VGLILLVRSFSGCCKGNIDYRAFDKRQVIWRLIEKAVGRFAIIFWGMSMFSVMVSICEDFGTAAISPVADRREPLSMLDVPDVFAMSLTGMLALVSYSLCLIAGLVTEIRAKSGSA